MKKSDMCKEFIALKAQAKEINARVDELKSMLKAELGDKPTKKIGDYVLNLAIQHRKIVDTEKLKANGLYEDYSKESIVELFSVK
jgi:hypothetical protein